MTRKRNAIVFFNDLIGIHWGSYDQTVPFRYYGIAIRSLFFGVVQVRS